MSLFRVIVHAPGATCVAGVSTPSDFVTSSQLARGLRQRGFTVDMRPNLPSVDRWAKDFMARHAGSITEIVINQCEACQAKQIADQAEGRGDGC
jgi:hypothetical protein